MALSNTATPIYYGRFREAVMRGEIPVCREISMEMNRIDDLIANPGIYYDDKAVNGFIAFCEDELTLTDGTVLDMMQVYEDLDKFIQENEYDVRAFGYDPYNAKEFVERWAMENSSFGIVKVIQGAKTESVPLGELKKLSEQRKLIFDEKLMQFAMGNCVTLVDTNGNRKLYKQRQDQKIDAVAAMMDAYIAWKQNRDAFE